MTIFANHYLKTIIHFDMKKTFLIAVLLLTSAIVNNAKAIVGDVNGDGYVTAADITV